MSDDDATFDVGEALEFLGLPEGQWTRFHGVVRRTGDRVEIDEIHLDGAVG